VDRELWDKTILNLLSDVFKFTFSGEIAVSSRQSEDRVQSQCRILVLVFQPPSYPICSSASTIYAERKPAVMKVPASDWSWCSN
jgi:hypothetical protein